MHAAVALLRKHCCTHMHLHASLLAQQCNTPALRRASKSGVVPGGRRAGSKRPLSPRPSQVAKVAAAMIQTVGTNQDAMASASAWEQARVQQHNRAVWVREGMCHANR
jgi:hypothetical protein